MNITSPSFPQGAQCDRTEQEVRACRPINMVQVIRNGVAQRAQTMGCPWCKEPVQMATKLADRFVVGCENPDCYAVCQVSGDTPEQAMQRWNGRVA